VAAKKPPEVVIVVPKDHELRELQRAFNVELTGADGEFDCGALWYKMTVGDSATPSEEPLRVAVVFLNNQGSSLTTKAVTEALHCFHHPPLLILFGTAAGRHDRTRFGDVVVSTEGVLDVTQQVITNAPTHRPAPRPIRAKIKADVCRFLTDDGFESIWRSTLADLERSLKDKGLIQDALWSETPRVMDKMVAGGDFLYETHSSGVGAKMLDAVWKLHDHLRCIDMESAGFCSGVHSETRQHQWIVVRGVSDSGTDESRASVNKKFGSLAAAAWLKLFLCRGLRESHPRGLKPRQEETNELPQTSVFASVNVGWVAQMAQREFEIDLTRLELGTSLALDDFVAVCIARGAPAEVAHEKLREIRADYFTQKYSSYTYSHDLRGVFPQWADEIHSILEALEVNVSRCRVLDVGIGNGLEIPDVFSEAHELIGVDVSKPMLDRCAALYQGVQTIHAAAEDLREIASGSIDLYASFRTYQSSLFDINAAIREAHRVLVREGVFVASIANGFVHESDGEKCLVRGLLVPGTKMVDRSLPYKLGNQILERLHDFGFIDVGTHSHQTDVYIYGRKP
jgi:SAM-dependent methyltransferase/nucleoside phosphorylase